MLTFRVLRVAMAVVNVRVVGMLVRQHFVPVRVRVRFVPVPGEVVRVLVMLVVAMPMRVLQRFVGVFVLMPLAHVQPDTEGHERRGAPKERARHFRPDGQ